jgi:methylase of polypeptide subunit release factors
MTEDRPLSLGDVRALASLDDESLATFRARLGQHGFDDALLGRLEGIAPRQLDAVRLPLVRYHLRTHRSAASTLARLFAYADPVERALVDEALSPSLTTRLLDVAMLVANGEHLQSAFRVMPFGPVWITSDDFGAIGDPVMGPGATTQELARAIDAEGAGHLLDVGCGAGSLALRAAARGTRVTGVDLHERAIELACFNARLNGLEARFLSGDLFAPVRGERFDQVVAQPPFVVQPPDLESTTYLHGGTMGDELTMRLLAELPAALAPGGRGLVLFDSAVRDGEPLIDRVLAAVSETPLEIVAFVAPGASADLQAIAYSAVRHPRLDTDYAHAVERYRSALETKGIRTASHVLLSMVAVPAGARPFAVSRVVDGLSGLDRATIEQAHAALRAATLAGPAFDSLRVRLALTAWLVEEREVATGRSRTRIRFDSSALRAQELSDAAAGLVECLQGSDTIAAGITAFAELASATVDDVRDQVHDFVRSSLAAGFLSVVGVTSVEARTVTEPEA